jgi:hypothetical protein
MTMTHSRRTSFDCQLVDAYLVSLQSDIEAKWRDIRCIRDDIHLLMRSRAGSSAADSEAVRTITERLDRMLRTKSFGKPCWNCVGRRRCLRRILTTNSRRDNDELTPECWDESRR